MKFSKVLIANRGEIAVRVMQTAKAMGYQTVAVYSNADRHARHVQEADEAVYIGASKVSESYLSITKIIDACKKTGADAVHPGYGFLSENTDFAQACIDNQITFIGPTASAIELMGSKRLSKIAMIEAGVPCVPGYEGDRQELEYLATQAEQIGFPLMVKASAGGGGRGMRLVQHLSGLVEALQTARSEAENAFGSGELILEKAVIAPRHVEIQVFGDTHGNYVYLFERDCSIQRRHQKVLEEAPAPNLPEQARADILEACVHACQLMQYRGAGTFEFLFEDGEFFFIEMNTRVQVEHPVTEMVTGVDIIEQQLRIAGGLGLELQQEDIKVQGHAIECRINAEDPTTFLPSPGKIESFYAPGGAGIRLDSHIYPEYSIPPYYDSMIAKLISHGKDRETSIARMRQALDEMILTGIKTNIPLHKDLILQDKSFCSQAMDIHYLEKHLLKQVEEKKAETA